MSRHLIEQTKGRWRSLLLGCGIPAEALTGKHVACPICGGKDRFRFDDRDGSGSFFCSQCDPNSGYGIHLVQRALGIDYAEACRRIESLIGTANPAPSTAAVSSPFKAIQKARELWEGATVPNPASPVGAYLLKRGLSNDVMPRCVRHHPQVLYLDEHGEFCGRLPAMLALIVEPNGKPAGVHRTYLTASGSKADVPAPRKILGSLPDGSAVRLSPHAGVIGIAEGIETALAAEMLFRVPVWAALTANNLEKWAPPSGVERVFVFGDADESFTGQAAAYGLARRLKAKGFAVEAHLPATLGKDWNDVLQERITS